MISNGSVIGQNYIPEAIMAIMAMKHAVHYRINFISCLPSATVAGSYVDIKRRAAVNMCLVPV